VSAKSGNSGKSGKWVVLRNIRKNLGNLANAGYDHGNKWEKCFSLFVQLINQLIN